MLFCRNFLWDGKSTSVKIPLVAWILDFVCKPKAARGLGLRYGLVWNQAAVTKYVWNIANKADSLWVKWVDHLYIKGAEPDGYGK